MTSYIRINYYVSNIFKAPYTHGGLKYAHIALNYMHVL